MENLRVSVGHLRGPHLRRRKGGTQDTERRPGTGRAHGVCVCVFVVANLFLWGNASTASLRSAGSKSIALLALSAFTTTVSWVCYYRAMKDGTVSFVSLVDKGSILVTLALSVMLLGEPFTWRIAGGAALIISGLLVLMGGK